MKNLGIIGSKITQILFIKSSLCARYCPKCFTCMKEIKRQINTYIHTQVDTYESREINSHIHPQVDTQVIHRQRQTINAIFFLRQLIVHIIIICLLRCLPSKDHESLVDTVLSVYVPPATLRVPSPWQAFHKSFLN